MLYKNLVTITYMLIIISIFLKYKIYPAIMIFFIFLNIINIKKISTVKKENIFLGIFLGFAILNYAFFNREVKNLDLIIKLGINISFLIAFINLIDYIEDYKSIFLLIKILIILTFIQIVIIYYLKNINIFYFLNIESSHAAYVINLDNVPFILANENKNIWSTKILFLSLTYLFYSSKRKEKNLFFRIFIIINCILLVSRTGYLALILYLSLEILLILFKKYRRNKALLFLLGLVLTIIFYFGIRLITQKLLRIDYINLESYLNSNRDGGSSRLRNWFIFIKYYFTTPFLRGIGIGNTKNFLISHNGFPDDNMHNFIFNTLLEQGVIIFLPYILYHFFFIKKILKQFKFDGVLLILPFYLVISLHYLGYDNDLVVYISLVSLIIKIFKKRSCQKC